MPSREAAFTAKAGCLCAGIDFVPQIEMPGASMVLSGVDLSFEDSIFESMTERGQAVLSFSGSRVTFRNCSFSGGSNAAGQHLATACKGWLLKGLQG